MKVEESDFRKRKKTITNLERTVTQQLHTNRNLISNMAKQKARYIDIVNHYNDSVNNILQEYERLYDSTKDHVDVKEYPRSADDIRIECNENYNILQTLHNEMIMLSQSIQHSYC